MRTSILACVVIGASVVAPAIAAPVVTKQPVTDCNTFLPNFPASFISCATADSGRSHKFGKKDLAQYQKRQFDIGSLLQGGLQLLGGFLGPGGNGSGQGPDLSGLGDLIGGLGGLFGKRDMAQYQKRQFDIGSFLQGLGGNGNAGSQGSKGGSGVSGGQGAEILSGPPIKGGSRPSASHIIHVSPFVKQLLGTRSMAPAKPSNSTKAPSKDVDLSDADIDELVNSILGPLLGGSNSTASPGDDAGLEALFTSLFQPILELLGGLGDSNGTVSADVRRRAGENDEFLRFLELLTRPVKRSMAPAMASHGTGSASANGDLSEKDIEELINSILQPIIEAFSGLGDIFGADDKATVAGKNATVSAPPAKSSAAPTAPAKNATSTPPQKIQHRRFSIDLD